ncbi:MAG: murein biosynthesis integral membrane protein MurJ [Ardenticatenaceae bacterium]
MTNNNSEHNQMVAERGTSNRKRILKAAGIASIASLLFYFISFLREAVVSMYFGISADLDALLLAQMIPLFLAGTIASTIQAVIVPLYTEMSEDTAEQSEFINKVYTLFLLFMIGITAILALITPWMVQGIGSGLEDSQKKLLLPLFWLLLLFVPFKALSGFKRALFYAEKDFWSPGISPAIMAVVTMISVWFGSLRWGIYSLAFGIALGSAVELLVTGWLLARRGIRLRLTLALQDRRLRKLFSLSLPLAIGSVSTGTIVIIDRMMASTLSVGSISALGYAERINGMMLLALGSLQMAVFPFFAEQAGLADRKQLIKDFKQTISLICFILAPVSLIVIFFNRPLVALLFQRGSFDAQATAVTGDALVGYVIGLIPMAVGFIYVRIIQALQINWLIGFVGFLNPFIKIMLNWLMIPFLGHTGIALATSGMYFVGLLLLMFGLGRYVNMNSDIKFIRFFIKIGIGLLAMVLVIYASALLPLSQNDWNGLIYLCPLLFFSIVTYWLACYFLNVEEAIMLLRVFEKLRLRIVN